MIVKFVLPYQGTETDGAQMSPGDELKTLEDRGAWLVLAGYAVELKKSAESKAVKEEEAKRVPGQRVRKTGRVQSRARN